MLFEQRREREREMMNLIENSPASPPGAAAAAALPPSKSAEEGEEEREPLWQSRVKFLKRGREHF